MRKLAVFLLWPLLLFVPPALAQRDAHLLDEITVEGRRPVSAERNLDIIDLETEAKPVLSTVPDALDRTPGLDVQRRSILTPKSDQVRIRGLTEKRSLILLDGRPLNGTGVMGGQFVDWSALSLQGWESVEVSKGGFSAKHGNTLGGTINLVPLPPAEDPRFSVRAGYKRYATGSVSADVSARSGPFGAFLAAGYDETGGHLRNSGAERTNIAGRFYGFRGEDGEIMLGFRYMDGDYEMPVENRAGTGGFDAAFPESSGSYLIGPGIQFPGGDRHGDGSFYNKKRYETDLSLKKNLAGLDSQLKLYFNKEDREDTIRSFRTGEIVLERDATPDRSWGWTARFEKAFSTHVLGFGADGNYQGYGGSRYTFVREDYFPRSFTDGADEKDGTRWHGAFVDDRWTLDPRLELYAGLRFEDYRGDRTADTVLGYNDGRPAGFGTTTAEFDEQALLPKLGMVYRPADGWSLHGRFARSTRFPDNPAFYWYYGGYQPELDPGSDVVRKDLTFEDALQYEVGTRYTGLPGWLFALTYYRYDVDDYIRWIFGYAPSRLVYNIDNVRFDGVEAEMEGRIRKDIHAFANLSWQTTKKRGDVLDGSDALTDKLSELPEWKFNFGVKYQRSDGALARIAVRWVDERQVPYLGEPGAPFDGGSAPAGTPAGRNASLIVLDDFMTVDLLFQYPVWKRENVRALLTAGVENLFDEDYREEYDFPAPGRVFHIGAEVKF